MVPSVLSAAIRLPGAVNDPPTINLPELSVKTFRTLPLIVPGLKPVSRVPFSLTSAREPREVPL